MKRLSALVIGVFMVVSAQTAFGLTGGFDEPDPSDGINAVLSLGNDRAESANCTSTSIHGEMNSEIRDFDAFEVVKDCAVDLSPADADEYYQTGI